MVPIQEEAGGAVPGNVQARAPVPWPAAVGLLAVAVACDNGGLVEVALLVRADVVTLAEPPRRDAVLAALGVSSDHVRQKLTAERARVLVERPRDGRDALVTRELAARDDDLVLVRDWGQCESHARRTGQAAVLDAVEVQAVVVPRPQGRSAAFAPG